AEENERAMKWTASLLEGLSEQELRKVDEGLDAFYHLFDDLPALPSPASPKGKRARPTPK
ncbi:MAG: hypothetical protein KIT07_10065, partial [Anaerolineales bacterium]|nr:hypothetical protein [Anaerolineales bacterium]